MDARISFSNLGVSKDTDFLHVSYTGRNKDAISIESAGYRRNTHKEETSPKVTFLNSAENKQSKLDSVMRKPHSVSDTHCTYSSAFSIQNPENEEKEAKSLILVRCDFKKSVKEHPYHPPLTPFNRSTSLMNYFKEEQNCTIGQSSVPQKYSSKDLKKRSNVLDTDMNNDNVESSVDSDSLRESVDTSCEESQDTTLESPESRKKELCSYLQLMNPADKKEIYILQNRRSTRVRNLAVIQKQKQIQNEISEATNSERGNESAIQVSPKELFVKIDQRIAETRHNHESFCFPFPPESLMKTTQDFDIIMGKLVPSLKRICNNKKTEFSTDRNQNTNLLGSKGLDKLNLTPKKSVQKKVTAKKLLLSDRMNSLRSRGELRNVPIKKFLRKKDSKTSKWKLQKQKEMRESNQVCTEEPKKSQKVSETEIQNSHCEIVTVPFAEDNNDLEHFIKDMVDFDGLSEEHRKCLIESRIFSTKPAPDEKPSKKINESLASIRAMSPLYGFSKTDTSLKNKVMNNSSVLEPHLLNQSSKKTNQEVIAESDSKSAPLYGNNTYLILNFHGTEPKQASKESNLILKENPKKSTEISLTEHDYAGHPNKKKPDNPDMEDETAVPIKNVHVGYLEVNTKFITKNNKFEILPHNKTSEVKSLHRSLQFGKKKNINNLVADATLSHEWDAEVGSPKQKSKKQSHSIAICKENGQVIKAFYVNYNLIVCQEYVISFWMQTPLGNILGSQDMWVPRGHSQRLVLNNKCIQKESMEKVVCTETSVVYIELWMKEHKSEMRQGPVADVFATLYFWKQRQSGLDKKVLQLENINGFADDVQYSVMKTTPKIIVSWHSANEDTASKRTFIHAYLLAEDFQTVSNIYDIEPVDHYVSSLHNIEDCDSLIMGCGENKITLWNVEFGYIVATIELSEIKSPLSTLWVKCDRGFLFALQQCVDRELRLVAIHGMNHSWKKLASYLPPEGFDRLRGVSLENGLLISFYDQGILCWKAETGEPVDEISLDHDVIPSGKHVIIIEDNQIIVKHVVTHLMSLSVDEG